MKHLLIAFCLLLISPISHALIDFRVGYGTMISKPDLGKIYTGTDSDIPSAAPSAGLNMDVIATLPIIGLGAGLRYEDFKINYDSGGFTVENSFKRTSMILNWRLIDTLLYVGPILTYGMNHTNKIKFTSGAGTLMDINSSSVSSYSVGLEAGAKLIGLRAGAEMGYMNMTYKDATDSVTAGKADLNMSGNYVKVMVGFGF